MPRRDDWDLGGLFARRRVQDAVAQTERSGYRRALGPFDLTSLGVAAIIGAGIFALLGNTARDDAGPAVMLSILIAGAGALLAAFAFAEFASVLPGSGSAYAYAYTALGRFPAFLIGWFILVSYAVGNMTVAIVWSDYLTAGLDRLGLVLPDALRAAPGAGGLVDLPALLIMLVVTGFLLRTIRENATVNNLLVAFKITVVLFFIGLGLLLIRPANYAPFFPPDPVAGVTAGAALIFFAYLGFDTVSAVAEESRNPRRDLPIGIVASLVICTLVYVLMAAVITGIVPAATLEPSAPLAAAFTTRGYPWAGDIIILGAIAATTTVLLAFQVALTRVLRAMARDGFLPAAFERLHPRFQTPWTINLITGIATALGAGLLPLGPVADLAVLSALWFYISVCAAVLILKRLHPDLPRAFRTHWTLPAAGALILLGLAVFGFGSLIQLVFAAWTGLGLVAYGFYAHPRVARRA